MIPMVLTVKIGRGPRLWIPLIFLWIILTPFAVVLAPVIALGFLIFGINPLRAFAVFIEILTAFSGTRIDVEDPDADISIRIF